ncbi:MAG TPA: thiamine phosphate synthase [Candidatus Coprocola pullicola]|nr:thiamine phosphate synthase [Candidatus Coprocola pullicola]
MKVKNESMLVYAVTDRAWLNGKTLEEQVEKAIQGGATLIQLREKQLHYDDFLEQAIKIKKITAQYHIPFIINDNVEIALAVDADGVHVGQKDMQANMVRKKLGENKIIGVSVQTLEQALSAEKNGADYLGVGAVFSTSTKQDASEVSFETLQNICKAVSIPVVAIGGINIKNIAKLKNSGIDGVAVVSAIFAQKDITKATQELVSLSKEILKNHC